MCRIRKYHIGRIRECVKTIPTETSIFRGNVISADRLCISLQSRRGFEVKLAMNSFLCRLSPAGIEIFLEIQLVSRIVSALISTRGSSRATILGFLYLSYCILVDLTHFKISEVLTFLLFAKFYLRQRKTQRSPRSGGSDDPHDNNNQLALTFLDLRQKLLPRFNTI